MSSTKNLSTFGQAALALDTEFMQLEELSGQIERLSIDSEQGLERARGLLSRFSECSQRIGGSVQSMASTLDEARGRAERAAESVATRAVVIQQKQKEADQLLARFQGLAEMVKKVSTAVAQLQKPASGGLSAEEKALLIQHLPELDSKLGILIDEAKKLKDDARESKLKNLEKNADALSQSLQSVRRKLSGIA